MTTLVDTHTHTHTKNGEYLRRYPHLTKTNKVIQPLTYAQKRCKIGHFLHPKKRIKGLTEERAL